MRGLRQATVPGHGHTPESLPAVQSWNAVIPRAAFLCGLNSRTPVPAWTKAAWRPVRAGRSGSPVSRGRHGPHRRVGIGSEPFRAPWQRAMSRKAVSTRTFGVEGRQVGRASGGEDVGEARGLGVERIGPRRWRRPAGVGQRRGLGVRRRCVWRRQRGRWRVWSWRRRLFGR